MKTVLVVEDDSAIRQGIVDALRFAGYATLEARTGNEGRDLARAATIDLLLLDLILPNLSGFDVLETVRQTRPTLPVIILTARGEEDDRVRGLRLGADDYVTKPFSVRELLARVEAVLRRTPERPNPVPQLAIPDGQVDFDRREVSFDDGSRAELSEKEADLLGYLASNGGRAISRDEILRHVWRLNPNRLTTRTIDMHVANLRDKLRDNSGQPQLILTVRGRGYMYARNGHAPKPGKS